MSATEPPDGAPPDPAPAAGSDATLQLLQRWHQGDRAALHRALFGTLIALIFSLAAPHQLGVSMAYALPITFGHKVAVWLSGIRRHRDLGP